MKRLVMVMAGICAAASAAIAADPAPQQAQTNPYELAERFAGSKLGTMLFSTSVDPHWFKSGDKFWYSYKTGDGTRWYVVDPATRSRRELWDHDRIAAQLTETVRDPFIAAQLPIRNLDVEPDGHTFTFEVVSSQDAPKKSTEGLDSVAAAKVKQPKKGEKQVFYFSYDMNTGALTHLKDKEKETKELGWASVSPDGKTVVYAKDLNLYRMSREDYEKLKKDDKDTTVTDIQITTDGVMDFGYGLGYSYLNTDTIVDGKRKGVWGVWSPDSRYFVTELTDNRAVKPLWVINAVAEPRPTLETYKYQMPGEMEAPEEHLYLFDMTDNSRKEINTSRFKNQTISVARRPYEQKQRSMHDVPAIWLGDDSRFFVTRSSRDLHRIDICSYTIGQDTLVPIIEERMNTYQEVRPLATVGNGKELIQWSERDGWARYLAGRRQQVFCHPIEPRSPPHRHLLLHHRSGHPRAYHRGAHEHLSGGAPPRYRWQRQGAHTVERARRLGPSVSLRRQGQPQASPHRGSVACASDTQCRSQDPPRVLHRHGTRGRREPLLPAHV